MPVDEPSGTNKRSQDQVKKSRADEKRRQKCIETCVNVFQFIKENPEQWQNPEFKKIREYTTHFVSNPDISPPTDGVLQPDSISVSAPSLIPDLTKKIMEGIYSMEIECADDCDDPPILQVTAMTYRYRSNFTCQIGKEGTTKCVTLHAIDAGGEVATLKLATQLNGYIGLLKEGVIIQLNQFRSFQYNYMNEGSAVGKNIVVLVTNLTMRGGPFVFRAEPRVEKRLTCAVDTIRLVPDGAAESVADDLTQDDEEIIENGTMMNVCCSGGLCSRDGLMMRRCIVETHPIKKLPIELIVSNCPFVEGNDATAPPNKQCRFALYHWFATNIYHICGRGVR